MNRDTQPLMSPAQQRLRTYHELHRVVAADMPRIPVSLIVILLLLLVAGMLSSVPASEYPRTLGQGLYMLVVVVPMLYLLVANRSRYRREMQALARIEASPPPPAQWREVLATAKEQHRQRSMQLSRDGWLLTVAGVVAGMCVLLPSNAVAVVWIGALCNLGAAVWWVMYYRQTLLLGAHHAALIAYCVQPESEPSA